MNTIPNGIFTSTERHIIGGLKKTMHGDPHYKADFIKCINLDALPPERKSNLLIILPHVKTMKQFAAILEGVAENCESVKNAIVKMCKDPHILRLFGGRDYFKVRESTIKNLFGC